MGRVTISVLLSLALFGLALSSPALALAQDARKRKGAAEAYDRGTAAYLDGDYAEAAQWFETANRLAPAAPALMQAVRSHQRAEQFARAATLALQLQQDYQSEPNAVQYAASVLDDLSPQFVRVDVTCDQDCKLDLDGKLQEFQSFFLEPGAPHTVTANFEHGSKQQEVQGEPGTTHTLAFEAPPAPPPSAVDVDDGSPQQPDESKPSEEKKPLPPLYTYIGAGVTGALVIGAVVSGIGASAGVKDYEKAADESNACTPKSSADCKSKLAKANKLLSDGQSKETLTNILIVASAVVGVGTGVIALFMTDWSGDSSDDHPDNEGASLHVMPTIGGAYGVLEGRF